MARHAKDGAAALWGFEKGAAALGEPHAGPFHPHVVWEKVDLSVAWGPPGVLVGGASRFGGRSFGDLPLPPPFPPF